MKNYVNLLAFILIVTMILFASCAKDFYVIPEVEVTDTVSFTNDVIPIFSNSCSLSGCHNTGGIAPDLSPVNAYTNLFLYSLVDTADAESSPIYQVMSSPNDPMPPSGILSPIEIATVLAWIKQGAKEN